MVLIAAIFGTDKVIKIYSYPDGALVETIDLSATEIADPNGICYDPSTGNLIISNNGPDKIYIMDGISNVISSSFASPGGAPRALALDGSGNLISCDVVTELVYQHVGITSAINTSFPPPGVTNPEAVYVDDNGDLIVYSYTTDFLYVCNGISNSVKSSYAFPGRFKRGTVVIDGNFVLTDVVSDLIETYVGYSNTLSGSFSAAGDLWDITELPTPSGSADLKAELYVPFRGSADLFAHFRVGQGTADLKAVFRLRQDVEDLFAKLVVPFHEYVDLYAKFATSTVNASTDLMAKVGVRRIYDLSDNGGVGFYWEGVGRGHVDIQIFSPTGAWIGKFPDYANWTWVALTWDMLQEVDLDGSRPDKSQITGFLWTVHSAGDRHLDGIYGLPKGGDRDIFAEFVVRHSAAEDLKAEFFYNHFREDLYAKLLLRQNDVKPPIFSGYTEIGKTASWYYGNPSWHVYGMQNPNSKKAFYAAGRHWVFYCQGEINDTANKELCFASGKSGVWANRTYVTGATEVYGGVSARGPWSAYFDGTYIHLAFVPDGSTGDLYYMRGTPYTDGSIIWGSKHLVDSDPEYTYLDISVDVNGFPYIIRTRLDFGTYTGAWFTKSSTNDGTWTTDFNTEYNSENTIAYAQILRLSNGDMIILRNDAGYDFDEYLWNGVTLTNTKLVDVQSDRYTATVDADDVIHVVHYNTDETIKYRKRLADGSWTTDVNLLTGLSQRMTPTISAGTNGELIVFYFQGADVRYIRYTPDDDWSAPESRTLPYDVYRYNLHAPLSLVGGRITVYAEVEDNAPYSGTIYALNLRTYNPSELKAEFTLRQLTNDLKAVFEVGQNSANLKAVATIRKSDSQDLYAKLEVQASEDLKAIAMIRNASTAELYAKFTLA